MKRPTRTSRSARLAPDFACSSDVPVDRCVFCYLLSGAGIGVGVKVCVEVEEAVATAALTLAFAASFCAFTIYFSRRRRRIYSYDGLTCVVMVVMVVVVELFFLYCYWPPSAFVALLCPCATTEALADYLTC